MRHTITAKKLEAHIKLLKIYNQITSTNCTKCGSCCGPIRWSVVEDIFIKEYMKTHNIKYKMWSVEQFIENDLICPYYDKLQKLCMIYKVRPLVCRLQGLVEELPCLKTTNKKMPRQLVDQIQRCMSNLQKEVLKWRELKG